MSRRIAGINITWSVAGIGALMLSSACAREPESANVAVDAQQTTAAATVATTHRMIVHKTPTCGCCGLWVEHMQSAGFNVDICNSDRCAFRSQALRNAQADAAGPAGDQGDLADKPHPDFLHSTRYVGRMGS